MENSDKKHRANPEKLEIEIKQREAKKYHLLSTEKLIVEFTAPHSFVGPL